MEKKVSKIVKRSVSILLRIEDETKAQEDAKPKYAIRKFIYSIEV